MRRIIAGIAILTMGLTGCLHTPMPWSPDGAWIAYTVEVHALDRILKPGWIYDSSPSQLAARSAGPGVTGYRLWATRAATNTSVLLEESSGPLTAPGWSPDGHALAFGRVVTDANQSSRFEVVVVDGLTKRRVVSSRPLTALDTEVSRLPYQAIAWSPDGRYLAVPQVEPMGLAILRADNGRPVNVIPDAFLPSWSPSGGRLAFYVRAEGHSLQYLDSAIGQPRGLIDVGQATQAPGWTRDGATILVVARRGGFRPNELGDPQELLRVQLRGETHTVEPIRALGAELGQNRDRSVEGVSITFDRDADNLFCSTVVEGQPHQVTWYHPRDNAVFKKFPMIDPAIPVGSLSFSPDGRTLAARAGVASQLAYPVFCDTESPDLRSRLVAPDDTARLEWIATLTRAARSIMTGLPATTTRSSTGASRTVERPTILPVQSEFAANMEISHRLRRIGRIGRPLCDRPPGGSELDPTTRRTFDEARLFFDYLREDYGSALANLGAMEEEADTPEHRVALLAVRAQILLNQGQFIASQRVIGFLERIEGSPTRRAEWDGSAFHLATTDRPDQGWPRFLTDAATKLQAAATAPKRPDDALEATPDRGFPFPRSPFPFQPNPVMPPEVVQPPLFRRRVAPRPVPRVFIPPRR